METLDLVGSHIGLLIMAAIQYFAPEFIKEGRLYWLKTPLYIVNNKGEKKYYFSDQEFDKVRGKIKGDINRAKGIGALSPLEIKESMFGEMQQLEKLEHSEKAENMLLALMC